MCNIEIPSPGFSCLKSHSSRQKYQLVLSLGEQVRLRAGRLSKSRARVLATELGDDIVEVFLASKSLLFEHFQDSEHLSLLEMVASSIDMVSRLGR